MVDGVRLELKGRRDLTEVINAWAFFKDSSLFILIIILLTNSKIKLMTKSLKVSYKQKRTGISHRKHWTIFRTAVTEMRKKSCTWGLIIETSGVH